MTEDEGWRETFVPMKLLECNALGGALPLRLLVSVFTRQCGRERKPLPNWGLLLVWRRRS